MKRGIVSHSSGLTPEMGEAALRISEVLAAQKRATSELYFVERRRLSIDTADTGRFETRVATLIFLSFTNGDISIALPGCSVAVEGGTNRT